ncbi:MAG: hypothetical protein ACTHM6_12810 [Tepidisphaeraceae bacterium]
MTTSAAPLIDPVDSPLEPAVVDVPLMASARSDVAAASCLPDLPAEGRVKRFGFLGLALLIAGAFFVVSHVYWVNVHVGVDQNGYLVGGKMFAENLSMKQSPTMLGNPKEFDKHAFIANMWVSAANNPRDFYPKYPLGLPLIYAVLLWVGGSFGTTLCYLVSPVAMAGVVLGVFVLVRQFAGSFGGILAMLAFATSPSTAYVVNNPNSHATTLLCVVWGMIGVLHWWRRGGRLFAVIGGVLVGYAATIRYTEGALILPLAWAAFVRLNWRSRRAWIESALLLASWAVPVIALLTYNRMAMGTWTGYDATHESSGFAWTFFSDNWETLIRQLNLNGLLMIFPLSVIGLLAMIWWNWRVAMFVWLWVAPCLTTYLFYYWGPDNVSYLRFVVTVYPAFLLAAFWLIAHLRDLAPAEPRRVPLYALVLLITLSGLAAGAAAYYLLRLDLPNLTTHPFFSVNEFLNQPPSGFLRGGGWGAFIGAIVMIGLFGGAVGASALLRRSIVPTLAAGLVAALSIAVQADDSAAWLERESYEAAIAHFNGRAIRDAVPDGAMLVCREENLLQYLQFVTNDRCYTGLSFDRNWVKGRPRAATEDPVLIDPVRGQQLYEALEDPKHPGEIVEQSVLNQQARDYVSEAMRAKRRVFVAEAVGHDPRLAAMKKKAEGPIPDFIRRYINRPKDLSLVGRRIGWWNVPMIVKDDTKPVPRGRKGDKPNYRNVTYQLWEISGT